MKQYIKTLSIGIILGAALISTPLATSSVSAQVNSGLNMTKNSSVSQQSVGTLVKNVINILLWAIGIIAVVMIIIGGIRYATSNGDSNSVSAAKNTILYSVVGLVIAIFAYAIVNFVVDQVGK